MDRRVLLAGLAASAVAVPALAQTSGGSSMQQQPGAGASGTAGTTAGATGRMGGQMSQADMQHMQQTMMLGTLALETSRIAQEKAQNANLKQFAQFEIQEQQTLSEVLRSMMQPAATAATGAPAAQGAGGGAAAATGPAAGASMQGAGQSRQMVDQLRQASGAEFDRQYLQMQLQGHRDLLQAQETYLQSNPQNREHMNVAKMARGQIREHIALLEGIQQSLR